MSRTGSPVRAWDRLRARAADRLCRPLAARVAELEARLDHERLYPAEWANRRVRDRFGDRVQAGPFEGLTYPDWGLTEVDLFAPKLLGCYELELHDAIERAIADQPALVVNIGAADGFYAVGLAMRLPSARVVAFEREERHHPRLAAIAELNAVGSRVELRDGCDIEALREALEPGALLVCDCEGCELSLLRPDAIAALTACTLIVEAHDQLVAGVTPALNERFRETHSIEVIRSRPRYVNDFPQLGDIPLVTRQLAISEFRGAPMSWLVMTPPVSRRSVRAS